MVLWSFCLVLVLFGFFSCSNRYSRTSVSFSAEMNVCKY